MDEFVGRLTKLIDSPWGWGFKVLAAASAVWGVAAIYLELSTMGYARWGVAILALLLLASVAPVLLLQVLPSHHRVFQVPSGERYLYTAVQRSWMIDEDGGSEISTRRKFLFFSEPHEVDLSDTLFGSKELVLKDLDYQSEDATVRDIAMLNETICRVFWKPRNGTVRIAEPYEHHHSYLSPASDEKPNHKTMTLASTVRVVSFDLSVESKLPIRHAVVYKGRSKRAYTDHVAIARAGLSVRRTYAPLPEHYDEFRLRWAVREMKPGDTFYVVLYFGDGISKPPADGALGRLASILGLQSRRDAKRGRRAINVF